MEDHHPKHLPWQASYIAITSQTPYQILSVPRGPDTLVGLRVGWLLPRTRVINRLTRNSKRKVKYRADGEWEISAKTGSVSKKEAIECSTLE